MAMDKRKPDGAEGEIELDSRIQDVIGKSLQAHFDDILAAPMPDRFLVLLSELESKEQALAAEGSASKARSDVRS